MNLFVLFLAVAQIAADDVKPRLAVMDVQIKEDSLDAAVGESLSTVIASEVELRAGDRYHVISRNEVRSMIRREAEQQITGARDEDFNRRLQKLLNTQFTLFSSVAKAGDEWVITFELIDQSASTTVARQSVSYLGEPSGLVQLVRPYIARLVDGSKAEEYTGDLEVLVSEEEATVILGERELGLSPVSAVGGLPIGRHRVSVLKDGYVPFTQDVVIQRNELTLFQANLIDESSLVPWWQKWWVWTAVGGGLVAGGVIAAILLNDDEQGALIIDQPFGANR